MALLGVQGGARHTAVQHLKNNGKMVRLCDGIQIQKRVVLLHYGNFGHFDD